MRIVIDMQGAQAENRTRGIGRLSLSLAKAIAINRREHEVILALNGAFPESIDVILEEFYGILPARNIRVWEGLVKVSYSNYGDSARGKASAILREEFLSSLEPSVVLVMSLFEGMVDDAVVSIGDLSNYPTAVFLHDLIPLIYGNVYLRNPVVESWYMRQFGYLKRANLLLCNSDSTKRDGLDLAGFDEEHVVAVYAGKSNEFRRVNLSAETKRRLSSSYGLLKPFVMYSGGIDYRKNIEGLIRAFASLPERLRDQYQLAIVCSVHDADRARLDKIAKESGLTPGQFVMTGFVSEEDLTAL